jgi:hypothetical protein
MNSEDNLTSALAEKLHLVQSFSKKSGDVVKIKKDHPFPLYSVFETQSANGIWYIQVKRYL